jgi:hypothetical protein
MKQVASAFVMAAVVGLTVSARADELAPSGYTNADINGGYGCNVSGTLAGAGTAVGIAQYRPQGNGTFSEAVFVLHLGGIGVCRYAMKPGTGKLEVSANGTGLAQAIYLLQPKSNKDCPAVFSSHIAFVCSGSVVTADTCDIASLDAGVLLSGTCKKQNR